jgi:hypothetical protein
MAGGLDWRIREKQKNHRPYFCVCRNKKCICGRIIDAQECGENADPCVGCDNPASDFQACLHCRGGSILMAK